MTEIHTSPPQSNRGCLFAETVHDAVQRDWTSSSFLSYDIM